MTSSGAPVDTYFTKLPSPKIVYTLHSVLDISLIQYTILGEERLWLPKIADFFPSIQTMSTFLRIDFWIGPSYLFLVRYLIPIHLQAFLQFFTEIINTVGVLFHCFKLNVFITGCTSLCNISLATIVTIFYLPITLLVRPTSGKLKVLSVETSLEQNNCKIIVSGVQSQTFRVFFKFYYPGLRIRNDLFRIRIRIRIYFFFIPDPDPTRVFKLIKIT